MSRFKINARVWDVRQGLGTVLNPAAYEPLVAVKFDNGLTGYYMADGRTTENDFAPSIYLPTQTGPLHYVETILSTPSKPAANFKIGDMVLSASKGLGVIANITDTFIYCHFKNGVRKQFQLDGRVKKSDHSPTLTIVQDSAREELPALTVGTPVLVRNKAHLNWRYDVFLEMRETKYTPLTQTAAPQHECIYGVWIYCIPLTDETRHLYNTPISLQQLKRDETKETANTTPIKCPEITREKAVELLKLREADLTHYKQVCNLLAGRLYAVQGACPMEVGVLSNLDPGPAIPTWCPCYTNPTTKCPGSKNNESCWALYYSTLLTNRNSPPASN